MDAAFTLEPPAQHQLSAQGREDLAWLTRTLGALRVQGPRFLSQVKGPNCRTEGEYEVAVYRADRRVVLFYGRRPELPLSEARLFVARHFAVRSPR
jgi:hypothetical protein